MNIAIQISSLDLFYGAFHALKNVSLAIEQHKITALIGPSGVWQVNAPENTEPHE